MGDKADKQYHIGFGNDHGAKFAIMPGDPGRVEKIAQFLDNPRFYCQNREYTTWLGELEGETVMVISTGMGGPSTAICVEELVLVGVETFIRVGTCGGMAEKVVGGDVVIATSAIRQDGTSKEYVPIEFPAVADLDVTNALVQGAKNIGATWHAGVVQCKDSFYGQHSPDRMPIGYELKDKWDAWLKAGCLASEMESATLYIVAQILGVKAGCVLNTVWNQEREKKGLSNPKSHDTELAIRTAIEAVRVLLKG
ncbi:MAG: uridine phosphorylase [Oscillospiraceae bacterium]|nr:uridine phosphorylase [Oscillospiraceae bacterium]MCL2278118.1 uridine phosphorylase [Oscillospiraceae bacterium]